MQTNKITTYLGFAKKAGYILYGLDKLKEYNKKLYLIIICKSANEKYLIFSKAKSELTDCEILLTNNDLLDELLFTDNCKIIGIKNKSLAQAIIDNKSNILLEGKKVDR